MSFFPQEGFTRRLTPFGSPVLRYASKQKPLDKDCQPPVTISPLPPSGQGTRHRPHGAAVSGVRSRGFARRRATGRRSSSRTPARGGLLTASDMVFPKGIRNCSSNHTIQQVANATIRRARPRFGRDCAGGVLRPPTGCGTLRDSIGSPRYRTDVRCF